MHEGQHIHNIKDSSRFVLESEVDVPSEYVENFKKLHEFLIEKNPEDPESVPGIIYKLPPTSEYLKIGYPNYSQYACRGTVINNFVYSLQPFIDDFKDSPLSLDQRKNIRQRIAKLQAIYHAKDEPGVKKFRTQEEIDYAKGVIREIISEIGDAIYPLKAFKAAA